MGEFRMPSLGADMERGTLLEWRVKVGDPVRRGDIVAVVDTEKSTIEVEVFVDGVVESIVVQEGEEAPVGAVLAVIGTSEAAVPAPSPPEAPVPPPLPPPLTPMTPAVAPDHGIVTSPVVRHLAERLDVDLETVAATGIGARVTRADVERAAASPGRFDSRGRVSPYARRLARERDVDLAGVRGSGPQGAVVARDVPTAVAAQPPDRAARLRHAIAELMGRSKREIPHYYLRTTIDLSAALRWLDERNASAPVTERVLPAALLVKAVAGAARAVPALNGTWTDDGVVAAEQVHVGVVISLRGGGVVAPALHDVDTLPIDAVMSLLRDVVTRARSGRLRASEMADPTITVTDLGDQGVDEVYGVIYPPQIALVGFGAVRDRPWAVDGRVEVRPVVVTTLAADHRACDGRTGAKFLNTIDQLLQTPEAL